MRGLGMNNSGMKKGFGELNQQLLDEQKEVQSGVIGERQWLSEEDESRINKDAENPKCAFKELVEARSVLPRQQQELQRPQGSVIQWERFLPLRSLKVLLVENDDSTRHLVSALLRNCSYEVNAVASGQEAWKTLDDLTTHIDLVLTEVAMPCLSGIGLLCKIMSHKTFKSIPVIMMSSNDSMGIVFTCLSKGAVDFLVKPVRKNELKNLWQHVWRKCHFSCGSGGESVTRAQKSTRWESDEGSDNNDGCSGENDNGFVSLTIGDGSDNGSGTQSSWTKRTVEVDSPKPFSPDSRDPTILQLEEDPTKVLTAENLEKTNVELKSDIIPNGELRKETADLIDAISNSANLQKKQSLAIEFPNEFPRIINIKGKVICDTATQIPSLELSLKRTRDAGDIGSSNTERNVLRRSGLSAFSRYQSLTNIPNQHSNGNSNSNNNDLVHSTADNVLNHSEDFANKSIRGKADVASINTVLENERMQQDVQVQHHHHHYHHHHHHHVNQQQKLANHDNLEIEKTEEVVKHHELSSITDGKAPANLSSEWNTGSGSNNNNNGSKGSSTGQNSSSSAVTSTRGGTNLNLNLGMVTDNGVAGNCGTGGVSAAIDKNWFKQQREAALNKFRQKRKDRCFEKKVRYQSRKKLAEERPRVRGQFVRLENKSNNSS